MTISLAIAGANGRMGAALLDAAAKDARFSVAGSTTRGASAQTAAAAADVWIDFTTPDATLTALDALTHTKVRAAIIGTTGLNAEQSARIATAAQRIAIVYSGNFSLGVNVLAALVHEAAAKLGPDWDLKITETHHARKVDAPSGTALMLANAAATGQRPAAGINIASIRTGDFIGEHDVVFASPRETLTLAHKALDRALFADGALAAAAWAAGQPPGLYTMKDVLGL
ncbi:MAG: dihydrodipicolinate reductase C-terminal domain-containing protein [Terricaulis sp.]